MRLSNDGDFGEALSRLREIDPVLIGRLLDATGRPALRQRPVGFGGLASIIVAQQVSTASAAAIFERLATTLDPLTPAAVLAADEATLRAAGLSGGKIRSLRAAATAAHGGTLRFEALADTAPDKARAALLAVPGIGPWTTDIFMLFCLGQADAWPSGDLALQEATRVLLARTARPNVLELTTIGERWRPYRGVAAHLLWAYYRIVKGRPGTLLLPSDTAP